MSTLYLGTSTDELADALARRVAERMRAAGPLAFDPVRIIVPNRNLKRWLQLRLARTLGIAMNLEFEFFEAGVQGIVERIAGAAGAPCEVADVEHVSMMILAELLARPAGGAARKDLAPLVSYVGDGPDSSRDRARRAWQLAERLAHLFRDYEYHRADVVRGWLGGTRRGRDEIERAQRAMYVLVHGAGGLRERFGAARGVRLESLARRMDRVLGGAMRVPDGGRVEELYVFGLSTISPFHTHALAAVGRIADLHVYVPTPLAAALGARRGDGATAAEDLRRLVEPGEPPASGDDVVAWRWGRAGRESLYLLAGLLEVSELDEGRRAFDVEVIARRGPAAERGTVLAALQADLWAIYGGRTAAPAKRMAQDSSLQVLACPGIRREVETVRDSILANLAADSTLSLADVAVFVTSMETYRPAIQAVFSRGAEPLPFNLTDFRARESSFYGAGLLQLLDVSMGRFSRSEVFALLLNPCFMAATDVASDEVQTWLRWADALGVHHSFDRAQKRDRGYRESDLYTWHQGLRRLRLGQILAGPGRGAFADVVPFSDIDTSDGGTVGDLSVAVELLSRAARDLAARPARTAAVWARDLAALADRFLAVGEDRPEETRVRESAREALARLADLDHVLELAGGQRDIPLILVREWLAAQLDSLDASIGAYLTGGVTVSELQPMRPIPFRVAYVLGLGESLFPRRARPDAMDLRAREVRRGDIGPAEGDEYLALEAIAATSGKLYVSYVARDLEKDVELHPSRVVRQLERHIDGRILERPFKRLAVPLHATSLRFLVDPDAPPGADALACHSAVDRLLCLADPLNERALAMDGRTKRELGRELADRKASAPSVGFEATVVGERARVTIGELAAFLRNPIEAGVRRHLQLSDEEDEVDLESDDEPFFTDGLWRNGFLRELLSEAVVAEADPAGGDSQPIADRFADAYRRRQLEGRSPEGAFAEIDAESLKAEVVGAWGATELVLERLRAGRFLGSVVLGEAAADVVSHLRLPPLRVEVPGASGTRVVEVRGSSPPAWLTQDGLEMLVVTGGTIDRAAKHSLAPFIIARAVAALGADARDAAGLGVRVHACFDAGRGWDSLELMWAPVGVDEARAYVASLAAAHLDGTRFELMPFEIITRSFLSRHRATELMRPMADPGAVDDGTYATDLREAIEDDDGERRVWHPMKLLALVEGLLDRVPPDAFAKVRARFAPWYAGVAHLVRQEGAEGAPDG